MGEVIEIREGKPARCPRCTSDRVSRVLWGYPGPEMVEAWERGEIQLGGCVLPPDPHKWECRDCDHTWGRPWNALR